MREGCGTSRRGGCGSIVKPHVVLSVDPTCGRQNSDVSWGPAKADVGPASQSQRPLRQTAGPTTGSDVAADKTGACGPYGRTCLLSF
ncbi:hypothetical protein BHE74_00001664 [Ensete ventricosum]|nr:hypothetical protein BHE74_00001664 [Ensete ventricosum]